MASKKVLILNYHDICDEDREDNLYTINTKSFKEQLHFVKRSGISVIGLNDLLNGSVQADLSLIFTFDDGNISHYTKVIPILEELNFSACFFPIVNMIGMPERLSWENLKEMCEKGFLIGSHGLSHTLLTKQDAKTIEEELQLSKMKIENKIKREIKFFAAPYGWYNNKIIKCSKMAGYELLFATGLEINTIDTNKFVYYRWNITSKTTSDVFKNILTSKGKLSLKSKLSFRVKKYAKKILGHAISDRINRR